jgi:hypothetical protein
MEIKWTCHIQQLEENYKLNTLDPELK